MAEDPVVARAVLRTLGHGEALAAAEARAQATHVRADARTGMFVCRHCGTQRSVPDTLGVEGWLRESHDFVVRHRRCVAPAGS